MPRPRAVSLLVFVLALLASTVRSQEIDADIVLGDQFSGRLDDTTDVDVLRFESLAGFELTASVKGDKDPDDKTAPKLVPELELLDLTSGEVVASDNTGSTKAGLKKILLPSTGQYLLRVASGDDTTSGPFTVKTKGKLGKAAKSASDTEQVLADGTYVDVFEVLADTEVTLTIGPGKKSPALPAAPTLSGPTGNVDLAAVLKSNDAKGKHVVKKLVLSAAGSYTLSVDNDGADGEVAVKRKLKTPKVKGAKLGEPDEPTGISSTRTLSGRVRGPDGAGLPGVEITAADTLMAVTDDDGSFLVFDPPMGLVTVILDGSTSTATGSFPELDVVVAVAAAGDTVMMALALPDLDDPDTAEDEVAVDGSGAATAPIAATGAAADVQLSGPIGTLITIHGEPASGTVDVLVTPVDPSNVPMALEPESGAVDAASYVTIQPGAAAFDTGAGGDATGLDVVLPNDRGLPVGTAVDIWSFDHDAGAWVNRSDETGQQGLVVQVGPDTQIQASGVILEGGWHTPVVPVNADCATTVTGRVVDDFGQPVGDATIATSLGQFTMTAANGTFSVGSVPAYDPGALPACALPLSELELDVLTSVADGAVSFSTVIANVDLVQGGTTDVGDLVVTIPNTGALAGQLVDKGEALMDTVAVTGEASFDVDSNANGSFFTAGLAEGEYTASYTFLGDATATTVDFSIGANETTTINVQRTAGVGSAEVDVLVLVREDAIGEEYEPLEGAQVRLVGTDETSAAGILGTTGADGRVTFEDVDGPFTATALADVIVGGEVARMVIGVVDVTPAEGLIVIPIDFDGDDEVTADATLSGTVSNMPGGQGSVTIRASSSDGRFSTTTFADEGTGAYTMGIPAGADLRVLMIREDGGVANAFMVREDVGPAGVGQTLTEDFDANSSQLVVFDREVDLTYENTLGVDAQQTILELILWYGEDDDDAAGLFFFANEDGGPATVMLPDVDDPNLGGRRLSLLFEQSSAAGPDDGIACDVFLDDDPEAITFSMPDVPGITNPSQDDVLTVSELEDLTIAITPGHAGDWQGWLNVALESDGDTGIDGIDVVLVVLLLRPGTTSVTLPPTTAPLFSAGAPYLVCAEEQSYTGVEIDFDAFFGVADLLGSVNAIENASDGFCESFGIVEFETSP